MEDGANFASSVPVFQVNRDSPVCKFKLYRDFSTLGLELIFSIEIYQYIRFFDVQMKHLLVVHLLEGLADLAEYDESSWLVEGLREGWQIEQGPILAEFKHKVLLILTIKVIVHLLNSVGFADARYIR